MEFRILGPLEVEKEGRLIALGGSRQRVLLSALLLHANRVVSRDDLVDAIWGDEPPETASTALQGYVSALRKVVGAEVIVTRPPGYALEVGDAGLDARRFEELARLGKEALLGGEEAAASDTLGTALGLWRGRPLADLDGLPFVRRERMRLSEIFLGAVEDRVDARLALGADAELVPELGALVAEHPLRERLRAQLMLALYRAGRQAEALETYREGRRVLSDELGLEPGDALKQLERAILEQSSELGPVHRQRPPEPVAAPPRAPRRRIAVAVAVAVALAAAGLVAGITLAFGGGVPIRAESVAVVDAKSGKVIADVPPMPLGAHPQALAFGFHSVWVANTNDGTVSRLDATTQKVTGVIGVGAGVRDIATGLGSVWVANGTEGTVTRIDPALNAPVETLRLSGENAAAAPVNFIATGSRAVWVTRGSELLRIEPATGSVTRLATPPPVGLTVRGETAWVVTQEQRLLVVGADPAGRLSYRTEALPLTAPAAAPNPGGGAIWLIVYRGTGQLWKVSSEGPETKVRMPYFPLDLAYSAGKLWAVDVRGRLLRVDARRGRIEWTTALRPTLRSAVAVGDGKVWVAVEAAS